LEQEKRMTKTLELQVNGARRRVEVDPEQSLLSVLRDDMELTGAKYGCGEGQCGACTVLIGGQATRSCITPVGVAAGKPITTIEGLEKNGRLHPLQTAFLDADAMQCGYCTPGMIMSALALLRKNGSPSDAEIARSMEGNLCRCGTYPRIVAAVRAAAGKTRGENR
jgi:aerobic-type carbon monoxide dehydrogenase small subunit (CoxS/CutS family)